MTEPVVVILPEPPAANRYLRQHGHVTYKTREAKVYCALVGALTAKFRSNGLPAFPAGDVSVIVVWHRGRKAGDLGERTKVLYDALQGSVYSDDKQIATDWRRRVDAHAEIPKGHVQVEVNAI
jgi:Holliday junction resolvase RusA-like endonuclease